MAQGVRADPHPEPLERFGRLLGPRSSSAVASTPVIESSVKGS